MFLSVKMEVMNQIRAPDILHLKKPNGVCLQQSFARLTELPQMGANGN